MIIKSLELENFRNYSQLSINFDSGTNILYGDNAQGKTNILEAIYLSATTKSHKGSKDRDMINFESDESHIRTYVIKDGLENRVDMHLRKSKTKGIAINGQKIKKAADLLGLLNVVFFSPEDLSIIKNGPAQRRHFVDMELCQLNKLYVHALIRYNKVIIQRNKLLKELPFNPDYENMLDVWDMQLVQYGSQVIRFRREFIRKLNDIIVGIHRKLSGEKEILNLSYEPDTEISELEAAVKKSHEVDIKLKTTTVGPHRDDMSFIVNGIDIRKFGSQGQQRTAALSLKLAEIELVKYIVKDYPVLLLDDVLSELDGSRQEHLLEGIDRIQTLITCTGLEDFLSRRFQIDQIYRVVEGTVTSENEQEA